MGYTSILGEVDYTAPTNPLPYRPYWSFGPDSLTAIWATLQVPVDCVSATVEVFIWTGLPNDTVGYNVTRYMRWGFDAQVASRAGVGVGAAIGNQTGAATIAYAPVNVGTWPYTRQTVWSYSQRDSLGTITVSAGDLVHVKIYRDPTNAADNNYVDGALFMVDFEYTADS